MREATPEGRLWYMKEASEQMWSTRTLERNVSTQYYGRMMASQRQQLELPSPVVEGEVPKEYIKNPVVAEFMGFRKDTQFYNYKMKRFVLSVAYGAGWRICDPFKDETDIWLCRQHLFNGGGCDWEHRTDSSEIKMKNPGILSDYRDMSNQ